MPFMIKHLPSTRLSSYNRTMSVCEEQWRFLRTRISFRDFLRDAHVRDYEICIFCLQNQENRRSGFE